ncbi:hypothetical protein TPHA_0P01670 [Tetrapisispora phaffii CBS 4417]|uniref:Rab-GAP TBC domain-containing protein n=1 Tax=Tetrapisispora phaffii (strain ATCC 24235 / CBS 4417 / NBRC 1672 / NRRL Y-8282 / UCD 70-5) TaxID=1071381 RepID=G8C2E7_TETPH|nr:hypothetical protein TPHA_0P01670 [Tetrapisispora phaffii CBS 4417]CCE66325.1 hypothetical protein TPHA_0P01670 [Tetrapisispora phaffii CBS 4417]
MNNQLVFCKSKVCIHPSTNASNNIAGYLLITKQNNVGNVDPMLQYVTEDGLDSKHRIWLDEAEMKLSNGFTKDVRMPQDLLFSAISMPYSFAVKLNSLYSIQLRLPSPNKWWFGSVILHSKSPQEDETLPILFFHDDVCRSTIAKQKKLNKSFDPFNSTGEIYWGGSDLKDAISKYVDLQQTIIEPTIWLVNATLDDLRNFSTNVSLLEAQGKSNVSANDGDDKSTFWDKMDSTKWNVMSRIADATSATGSFVSSMIRKHPIVQLAERNKNNVYVKKLLNNPRVKEIQDDYDSATIYLAKWAQGVKEQSDKFNLLNETSESYRKILNNELGMGNGDNDISFSDFELNKALERSFPLTQQKWNSFFDSQGRINITINEIKDFIFHGGIESIELRKTVWLYLLGVYPWDSSYDEKLQIEQTLRNIYNTEYKSKWLNRVPNSDPEEEEYWHDQIFRIEKDVRRNDRNIDIYKYNTPDGKNPPQNETADNEMDEDENTNLSDSTNSDSKSEILNPHLLALKNILISYNVLNTNLGYVQGMTDLLSIIYYIVRDEELAFWCFVNFMERMERNFLRDQSGIRDQMYTLAELCQIMLPQLSKHLSDCDSSNLFFCFRMILVWFKREFDLESVCSIWEILLTDYYSSQFQLFFMLAILQKNNDTVVQNLTQFDQVLKFFNDINGTLDWSDLMTRSELLFIRFKKMMDLMERNKELQDDKLLPMYTNEDANESNSELKKSDYHLQLLLSKQIVIQREEERTKDSIK